MIVQDQLSGSLSKKTQRNYIRACPVTTKRMCAHRQAMGQGLLGWSASMRLIMAIWPGAYKYDGRWLPRRKEICQALQPEGGRRPKPRYRLRQRLFAARTHAGRAGREGAGLDISEYGIAHAKEEVKPFEAGELHFAAWPTSHFDFVYTILTFHNLQIAD